MPCYCMSGFILYYTVSHPSYYIYYALLLHVRIHATTDVVKTDYCAIASSYVLFDITSAMLLELQPLVGCVESLEVAIEARLDRFVRDELVRKIGVDEEKFCLWITTAVVHLFLLSQRKRHPGVGSRCTISFDGDEGWLRAVVLRAQEYLVTGSALTRQDTHSLPSLCRGLSLLYCGTLSEVWASRRRTLLAHTYIP